MKFSHFLLAAGLCSFSAASAQTTPTQTTPRTPNNASPNTTPSGTAPVANDPRGNVQPGEEFTKGAPNGRGTKQHMKHKKDAMSDGSGKMKTKM